MTGKCSPALSARSSSTMPLIIAGLPIRRNDGFLSLDDFSRRLLHADFYEQESTWAHIRAAETVVRRFGIPLQYYVDSLRVSRFVQGRDSFWRKQVLQTDEAGPQWRQVMRVLGVDVIYALSPQAKGGRTAGYKIVSYGPAPGRN